MADRNTASVSPSAWISRKAEAVDVDTVARFQFVDLVVEHHAQPPLHQIEALLGVSLGRAGDVACCGPDARDKDLKPAAQVGYQQFTRNVAGGEGDLDPFAMADDRVACGSLLGEIERRYVQCFRNPVERVKRGVVAIAFDQAQKTGCQISPALPARRGSSRVPCAARGCVRQPATPHILPSPRLRPPARGIVLRAAGLGFPLCFPLCFPLSLA